MACATLAQPAAQQPFCQEASISHRFRTPLVVLTALAAAAGVAACGGDEGGDEDPQEVLNATFQNDLVVSSGAFDVSLDVEAEGGDDPGTLQVSIGGQLDRGDVGAPLFDLTAEAERDSAQQQSSADIGVVSTGESGYVSFQGSAYEVPAEVFDRFEQEYQDAQGEDQGDGSVLPSLDIDPTDWLTDLSNEGTEEVEGVETVHISGEAEVPGLVEDLKGLAERVPDAVEQVSPADLGQIDQLTGIIESADFDIYSGVDDDILRKLEATLELNPPDAAGGAESVSVNFAITLSDVNEPQTITAPAGAQPLSTLLEQFGVDPNQLGQLQQ